MIYNALMRAEVLSIGSELTQGATVNTNAAYLSRKLADAGIACARHTAISDDRIQLVETIRESLRRSSIVIMTGGLGPTFDDVTAAALAKALHQKLVFNPKAAVAIRRFYSLRHQALQQAALRQALIPKGADALPNPVGTAPGIWIRKNRNVLVALPGVPAEMRAIFENSVLRRLKQLSGKSAIVSRTIRTIGLVELQIQEMLRQVPIPSSIEAGLYPNSRMVDIRLTAKAASKTKANSLLKPVVAALQKKLGRAVYGLDAEPFEAALGKLLIKNRLTVAVAESCTAGMALDRLTQLSGSSAYVRGGVVAYHNDLKKKPLGVRASTLSKHGAVSAAAACEMAFGVRKLARASIGISITGIAGPTGASRDKPVGLVFIGLSRGNQTLTQRHQFVGDRLSIKTQAAQTALNWLRCHALNLPKKKH